MPFGTDPLFFILLADLVGNHSVLHAALDEVIRCVRPGAVYELLHDIAAVIQLRHRFQLPVVQEPFLERAVHFFAYPAILAIIQVSDVVAIRQLYFEQIAQGIPTVTGRALITSR